jgi:hypothetical protein
MAALPRTAIDRIAGKDHDIWRRFAQIISNPRRRVTLNRNAFGEILRDFEVRNLVLRGPPRLDIPNLEVLVAQVTTAATADSRLVPLCPSQRPRNRLVAAVALCLLIGEIEPKPVAPAWTALRPKRP